MNENLAVQTVTPELRKRAWRALVKELGVVDALRFVMTIEPGDGDSVQDYRKMWEGKSIDEICELICRAKKQR